MTRAHAASDILPAVLEVRLMRGRVWPLMIPVIVSVLTIFLCLNDVYFLFVLILGLVMVFSWIGVIGRIEDPAILMISKDGFTFHRKAFSKPPRFEEHTWKMLRSVEVRHLTTSWRQVLVKHHEEVQRVRASHKDGVVDAPRLGQLEEKLLAHYEHLRAQTPVMSLDALRAMHADPSARFDVVIELEHLTEEFREATCSQAIMIVESLVPMISDGRMARKPEVPALPAEW